MRSSTVENTFRQRWIQSVIVLGLFFSIGNASALDLEQAARNIQRHGDWMSMDFRDPNFGMFIGSRASIEDKESGGTLNITFLWKDKKCHQAIELNMRLNEPLEDSIDHQGILELQTDQRKPQVLDASVSGDAGERFIYFWLPPKTKLDPLIGNQSLLVNARGIGVSTFSFKGAKAAIRAAKKSCSAFATEGFASPEEN